VHGADELEAHGEVVYCEAAGDRDGWDAREIGGAIQAQEKGARWLRRAVDGDRFFVDERSSYGSGGNEKGAELVLGEKRVK